MNSLRRSGFFRGEPRVIGGVCQGLAQRYGWDVNSLRIAVVVAALFFPAVCVLYALAWVFLPEAKDGRIHVDEMLKGNFDAAIIGAILLAVFGGGTSGIALGFFHAFVWIPLFSDLPCRNCRDCGPACKAEADGPHTGSVLECDTTGAAILPAGLISLYSCICTRRRNHARYNS